MKRKFSAVTLISVIALLSLAACKGAPPAQDVPEEIVPPSSDELSALDAAKAAAEKARAAAVDIDAQELVSSDWDKAEAVMNKAHTLALKATDDVEACLSATAEYQSAEKLYKDLYAKALPLFAASSRERIARAREAAVEAGALRYWMNQLSLADTVSEKAFALWDSGNESDAVPGILEARDAYFALLSASHAVRVRDRIETQGYKDDDPENFALGNEKLNSFAASFKEGGMKASRDIADEALLRFNIALNKALARIAGVSARTAEEKRIDADKIKASVASRDTWNEALDSFTAGEADVAAERYDDAIENFDLSASLFEKAGSEAADKRARALEAMQAAEEAIKASDEKAAAAEEVLEGAN